MRYVEQKLTETEYNAYKAMDYCEQRKTFEKTLSADIIYGYGFYGVDFLKVKDEYIARYAVGSTCD